jgi:hypothetical protein
MILERKIDLLCFTCKKACSHVYVEVAHVLAETLKIIVNTNYDNSVGELVSRITLPKKGSTTLE